MHVQSVQKYWFSLSNMQICGGFCCRRRRGCSSSLETPFALMKGAALLHFCGGNFTIINLFHTEFSCFTCTAD